MNQKYDFLPLRILPLLSLPLSVLTTTRSTITTTLGITQQSTVKKPFSIKISTRSHQAKYMQKWHFLTTNSIKQVETSPLTTIAESNKPIFWSKNKIPTSIEEEKRWGHWAYTDREEAIWGERWNDLWMSPRRNLPPDAAADRATSRRRRTSPSPSLSAGFLRRRGVAGRVAQVVDHK